MTNEYEELLRM